MGVLGRQHQLLPKWMIDRPFRDDATPEVLADGIQGFYIHTMVLHFCALHNGEGPKERLATYLATWLSLK